MPLLDAQLIDLRHRCKPNVVHDCIHPPKSSQCPIHQHLHIIHPRHIRPHRHRRLHLPDHRLQLLLISRRQPDPAPAAPTSEPQCPVNSKYSSSPIIPSASPLAPSRRVGTAHLVVIAPVLSTQERGQRQGRAYPPAF